MGKGKGAVEYWAAVVKPEELCLKLEFLCQLQRGVTSCSSKASSKKLNSLLLEISKHNLYYIMKQSEIKIFLQGLQETFTKKTYADLKWLAILTNETTKLGKRRTVAD
jgi:hypothetical protein